MELKRTPLYKVHGSLGARFTPFAGWEMPVQYSGVIEEHNRVRTSCGLFDVSHMGEVEISGPRAMEAVQLLATNDIARAGDGQCQYTLVCYPDGGVVDDCIVYRFSPERFLICVNASNTIKAYEWMKERASSLAGVRNRSDDFAQLALQGPASNDVIRGLLGVDPSAIRHFHFVETRVAGVKAIVSRTGYTGEDGFEIYLAPEGAVKVWDAIMEAGRRCGIGPAGLGARDTLRLEMGYPLYGHELSEKITPVEANLHKRFVSIEKKDFIGKEVLKRQAEGGVSKTLVGFEMIEPGIPRQGYEVWAGGKAVGVVTSGTQSPTLRKAIGMAFVGPAEKAPGTGIGVMIRGRLARARVVKTPFCARKAPVVAG